MVDIVVREAQGLPDNAYLSLRVGDVRRQASFKPGCRFHFDVQSTPRNFGLDVFEKVGSAQVGVSELLAADGRVQLAGQRGGNMSVAVEFAPAAPVKLKRELSSEARGYLQEHAVQELLHSMVGSLLETQPEDALGFMSRYLQEAAERQRSPAEESDLESDDDDLFPTASCPESLPDLSAHHNLVARALRVEPGIYERLRGIRSEAGVSLARCIKPGMDVHGHPLLRTVGLVAGDAGCYEAFRELFDRVVSELHCVDAASLQQPHDADPAKLGPAPAGASCARIRLRRNIDGVRMAPACSQEERREVERRVVAVLSQLHGVYEPFSQLPPEEAEALEPDSEIDVASGFGRDWPDARGRFTGKGLLVKVNTEDHLDLTAEDAAGDLQRAFTALWSTLSALEDAGLRFAHNERLGFLGVSPANLGTCLTASLVLRLPQLGAREAELEAACQRLHVVARPQLEHGRKPSLSLRPSTSTFVVSSSKCLGVTEVQQLGRLLEAASTLLKLDAGDAADPHGSSDAEQLS